MTQFVNNRAGHKFSASRHGSVSVEFALVMPIMLMFLLAIYEVATLYRTQMKLTAATNAAASMIAQQSAAVTPGTSGSMGNFCTGAQRMMLPQTLAISLAVASVTNNNGTVARDWETDVSCASTAGAIGSASAISLVTTPANLVANPGDSVIVVRSNATYAAISHFMLGSSYSLTATAWARPRNNTTLACTGC